MERAEEKERPESVGKKRRPGVGPQTWNSHNLCLQMKEGRMNLRPRSVRPQPAPQRAGMAVSEFDQLAGTWLSRSANTFFAFPLCLTAVAVSRLTGLPTAISATMPMP